MLDTVTTANREKLSAAVSRWIADATAQDNGAALDRWAERINDQIGVLADICAREETIPPHLVGITAFDLAEAREHLSAAARELSGWDGWTILHAEGEDEARFTDLIVSVEGVPTGVPTTLHAFLALNDLAYDSVMGANLRQGVPYRVGGGASPEWSFTTSDRAERAAAWAAWQARFEDEAA